MAQTVPVKSGDCRLIRSFPERFAMMKPRLRSLPVFCALLAGAFLSGSAHAGDADWSDNVAESLKRAEAQKKDVLMDFTGSDWCPWCIKLKTEIFNLAAFKKGAADKFVCVELDFPNSKPQSGAVKQQNQAWKEKIGIHGFPTVVLADAKGRPYARTGYQAGGPAAYLKMLEPLRQMRINRDEKFAAAEKATGIEKAKLLDEGLRILGDDELVLKFYGPVVEEIIKSDTEGKLKARYAGLRKSVEANMKIKAIAAQAKKDPQGTIAALRRFAADKGLLSESRQRALLTASWICRRELKDKAGAAALLDEVIAVDPDSGLSKQLKAEKKK